MLGLGTASRVSGGPGGRGGEGIRGLSQRTTKINKTWLLNHVIWILTPALRQKLIIEQTSAKAYHYALGMGSAQVDYAQVASVEFFTEHLIDA